MKCMICNSRSVRVQLNNQPLCMDCYNALMAKEFDVDLPALPKTFSATDSHGVKHMFDIERHITGTAILLTATEQRTHGYEFSVDGPLDADQNLLFKQLKEKTQQNVLKTYLDKGVFPDGTSYTYIKDDQLKGMLDYDETDSGLPLVIIDGKPYTWEEVGRFVQAFEGFHISIVMTDAADAVNE